MNGITAAPRRAGDAFALVAATLLTSLAGLAGCGGSGTTPPPADTTPPAVVDSAPADGALGVLTTASVDLVFSEPMDAASVEAAFVLTGPSGPVAGTMTWDAARTAARFSASSPLQPGQAFTASLGAGAHDLAGNPVAGASFSFTTAGVPEVVDQYPLEGWTDVSTGVEVRVTFGSTMDPASLQAAFSLSTGGGAPVAGTFRFVESEGYNLYFAPAARLLPSTVYDVVITTAATDALGTPLSTAYHLSFTTGAPLQRTLTVGNSPATFWGNAYGRVVDDLGRIDCGGDRTACTASYDEGTVVTLTPIAGPAAAFTGWAGDDCYLLGTSPTATLTLDVGRGCTARFEIPLGTTVPVSVTYGPWIARVYEDVDFGQTPHLDCGLNVVPSVCEYAFPAAIAVYFRAELEPTAPAGTIRWTCTSNDLTEPPTSPDLTSTGVRSMPVWPNQPKSCNATLLTGP